MREIMRLKSFSYVFTDGRKLFIEYLDDGDDEIHYREPDDKEAEEIKEYLFARR